MSMKINTRVKHRLWVGCAASLLFAASASAAVLPGFAGVPDPMSDDGVWIQNIGQLKLSGPTDLAFHRFTIPIPLIESIFSQSLTVKWQHGNGFLNFGEAEGRVYTFNQDGTVFDSGAWSATIGTPSQTVSVPAGGTAIFQVRMKADSAGICSHYISRVVSSGAAAL